MENNKVVTRVADKTMKVSQVEVTKDEASVGNAIIVYAKDQKLANSKETVRMYSGTSVSGINISFKFKLAVPTDSMAFIVNNVTGTSKIKKSTKNGKEYENTYYYITECDFYEIEGEPLPL